MNLVKSPAKGLVPAVITATLIALSVTPGTPVRCTSSFSAAPETSVTGGAPGWVDGSATVFGDDALPHALASAIAVTTATKIRVRIALPPWCGSRTFPRAPRGSREPARSYPNRMNPNPPWIARRKGTPVRRRGVQLTWQSSVRLSVARATCPRGDFRRGRHMQIRGGVRSIAVVVVAGGMLASPLALPASAALTPSVACAKLTTKLVGSTATSVLTGCTPAALKAGGTAVTLKTPPPGSKKGQLGSKITWKGGKGTTTSAATFTVEKNRGNCPAGTTRILSSGSVKSVTGAAKQVIKVGEPVTATVCAYVSGPKAGQTSLAPGTKYKL